MESTDDEIRRFATSFQRFTETMSQLARGDRISPVRELIDHHLGQDTSMIPILSETFASWDHVNV